VTGLQRADPSDASALRLSRAGSALFAGLVRTAAWRDRRGTRRAWNAAFTLGRRTVRRPVRLTLHGRRMVMNFGYAYPLFEAQHPDYNRPLVDAVAAARTRLGRPVRLVDVGAAVGDTVVLLEDRLGASALEAVLCVDGDAEFLGYLRSNLGSDRRVTIVDALLSRDDHGARELVRTHAGTASAQGSHLAASTTLDAVLADQGFGPDVVKVDTDGYDGAVLAGALETLARHRPTVVFEWHPALLERTGNPLLEPFEVLRAAGYDDFALSDRTGRPVPIPATDEELVALAKTCVSTGDGDAHFDVTADVTARAFRRGEAAG
jgi:FkbM family methyltransferase